MSEPSPAPTVDDSQTAGCNVEPFAAPVPGADGDADGFAEASAAFTFGGVRTSGVALHGSSVVPGAFVRTQFRAGAIAMRTQRPRRPATADRGAGAMADRGAAAGDAGEPDARPADVFGHLDPAAHLANLKKALRRERARGRSSHWTYNLSRHLALAQDVRRAEAALRADRFARQPARASVDEA